MGRSVVVNEARPPREGGGGGGGGGGRGAGGGGRGAYGGGGGGRGRGGPRGGGGRGRYCSFAPPPPADIGVNERGGAMTFYFFLGLFVRRIVKGVPAFRAAPNSPHTFR